MPTKKTNDEINKYYQQKYVVESYDTRRFTGVGGHYINDTELELILNLAKELPKKAKVLDVGAGRGRLSKPLGNAGFEVFCLDSSVEMAQILKTIFPADHIIQQSAFETLKLTTKIDLVTGLRFFDHFNIQDQKTIIANLAGALNADGKLIITALHKNSLEFLVAKLFPYGRYNYYYSNETYLKMFEELGYRVINKKSTFFLPRGVFVRLKTLKYLVIALTYTDKFLGRILPQFCALNCYLLAKQMHK